MVGFRPVIVTTTGIMIGRMGGCPHEIEREIKTRKVTLNISSSSPNIRILIRKSMSETYENPTDSIIQRGITAGSPIDTRERRTTEATTPILVPKLIGPVRGPLEPRIPTITNLIPIRGTIISSLPDITTDLQTGDGLVLRVVAHPLVDLWYPKTWSGDAMKVLAEKSVGWTRLRGEPNVLLLSDNILSQPLLPHNIEMPRRTFGRQIKHRQLTLRCQ